VARRPDLPADLESVELRQPDVEQDQVDPAAGSGLDRGRPVGGNADLITFAAQCARQWFRD